ncbi:transcriptional repressor [Pseudoflavonifractor sp. DSM 107456]|uniref:Transcriptional repressor n=1 Tax=Pseudoflavonifractor gallinarum TaxID=2779352 RepID=A0ABR9RF90_9FIRM|nr:transcriptional repressor [Pseudoflavonifractor gallinarum]
MTANATYAILICPFQVRSHDKKYDTRQRDHLIPFLEQHIDQPLSVREIAQALCAQQISLSAVYRNLSHLEAARLLPQSDRPAAGRHITSMWGHRAARPTSICPVPDVERPFI